MSARQRALVILVSLMVVVAGASLLLVAGSGMVGSRASRPGIQVAGAEAADLTLFKGEALVWTAGPLSPTEVRRVRDSSLVAGISAVRTGLLPVAGDKRGYPVIPVEAMAFDPDAYAVAAGAAGDRLLGMLQRGVVLSRTGAGLRKLRQGGRLRLTGSRSLVVAGIVDDRLLGGYEVAMNLELGGRLGITRISYLLLRPRGSVSSLEGAVRGLLHGRRVGFHLANQGHWFRAGDGTLPLAQVKLRFGEFAMASLARPVPDPAWVRANITTQLVPVLGEVRCHRAVVAELGAAMADVQREGIETLIDVEAFRRAGGCVQPRPVYTGTAGLYHQVWGIAFDLGGATRVDRRLVAAMARHGFTWGGRWLQPAGNRFEWVGAGA
jgi:hypothetical protein